MLEFIKKQFESSNHREKYSNIKKEEFKFKLSNGDELVTILFKPDVNEKFSIVSARTPYPNMGEYFEIIAEEFAKRGIAFVFQFCRGTGDSTGEWIPNVNERNDGKEFIDYLASLDWVKNIGIYGSSYVALTGWILADILNDKVKTMYLSHYGVYRHISAYKDGLFRHDVLTSWAMDNAGYNVASDYLDSCLYKPHVEVSKDLWGQDLPWYRDWVTCTDSEDPYWNEGVWGTLKEIPSKVDIPICVVEGWYDHHLGSALESYNTLSEKAKKKSTLVVGPWNHMFGTPIKNMDCKNGESKDLGNAFEWFYNILIEEIEPKQEIKYYMICDDKWFGSKGSNKIKTLYLGKNKDLKILEENSEIEEKVSYEYNPENPIYSFGGESMLKNMDKVGILQQEEIGYRDDVISFISDELVEDIKVCGKIKVKLFVESDAYDTAFAFVIMNVIDGKSYNVRNGITTLGYRNNTPVRIEYTPNSIVEIEIDSWDIAYNFKKGTKIRLDIQSSDFPQYAIHSNNAGVWSEQKESKVAKQTIYFGGVCNSRIEMETIFESKKIGEKL